MNRDKEMTTAMGGEVAKFVERWEGTLIRCFGTCRMDRITSEFKGYEHDGGLEDATGKKWWVYFECPECKYGHSYAKMEFFVEHTKIEHKSEEEIKAV